jgi:hypothetical protein
MKGDYIDLRDDGPNRLPGLEDRETSGTPRRAKSEKRPYVISTNSAILAFHSRGPLS